MAVESLRGLETHGTELQGGADVSPAQPAHVVTAPSSTFLQTMEHRA